MNKALASVEKELDRKISPSALVSRIIKIFFENREAFLNTPEENTRRLIEEVKKALEQKEYS